MEKDFKPLMSHLCLFLYITVAFSLGYLAVTLSDSHAFAQQAWQRELHQHELQREDWQNERQMHQLERQQWQREREENERERLEFERERLERERERDSYKPFWGEPQLTSERCLPYTTR